MDKLYFQVTPSHSDTTSRLNFFQLGSPSNSHNIHQISVKGILTSDTTRSGPRSTSLQESFRTCCQSARFLPQVWPAIRSLPPAPASSAASNRRGSGPAPLVPRLGNRGRGATFDLWTRKQPRGRAATSALLAPRVPLTGPRAGVTYPASVDFTCDRSRANPTNQIYQVTARVRHKEQMPDVPMRMRPLTCITEPKKCRNKAVWSELDGRRPSDPSCSAAGGESAPRRLRAAFTAARLTLPAGRATKRPGQ